MDESQALLACQAMSDATRLRILRFLASCGSDGATAGRIGEAVDASSSRASFHLSTLSQAGLVSAKKRSRSVIYRLNFGQIGGLLDFIVEDCCQSRTELVSCCGWSRPAK